ncbi:MAG: hypothetical protein ACF8SC_03505 [Phycisphaerales bacterium JB037]
MICMQPIGDELRHPAHPNTTPDPTPDPTPEQVLADFPDLDPDFDPISLLHDYLAADLPLLDLCEIHRLTLPDLERVLNHPFFTQRLAIHARLSAARAEAIRAAAQPSAVATLTRIASEHPATRGQRLANEAQRKAARALLTTPSRGTGAPPVTTTTPPTQEPPRPSAALRGASPQLPTKEPPPGATACRFGLRCVCRIRGLEPDSTLDHAHRACVPPAGRQSSGTLPTVPREARFRMPRFEFRCVTSLPSPKHQIQRASLSPW